MQGDELMKITIDRAKSALMEYVSDEFCNRLYDYRKWLVPVFIGSYMPKIDKMIEENKEGLVSLGFMDENGLICIDTVYKKFKDTAEEYGDVIQKMPLLGEVTFTSKDIDKLYKIIQYSN